VLAANPHTSMTVVDAAPVVGAALLGLDTLGATPEALAQVRALLTTPLPR
jgi:hypothetical protein